MEKFEQFKQHLKEHKTEYLTGIGFATITCLIMRGRYEALATGGAYGLETADTSVTMRPLSFFSSQGDNVVSVVVRNGRGNPGYIVRNLDTGKFFSSQREAASAFGISETLLSKHINGKIPNAEGLQFERLPFAA